ncbi:MAG: hypothetical protein IEMM0007_2018 [bacterium]|nr:MAG: hypothetical protein IEMM0007_2018 [bacterium]
MPIPIMIKAGPVVLEGELFDSPTARAITDILPIKTSFNVWGDEFYFEIPVDMPLDETATTEVKAGDIGYWPPGRAIAIFFGPTPLSSGPDPVPASEVNIAGRIKGDAKELVEAKSEKRIIIQKL